MTTALAPKPSRLVAPFSARREPTPYDLRALRHAIDASRGDGLTADEMSELDLLAFAHRVESERREQRATMSRELRRMAVFAAAMREPALIASIGAPDAPVQAWEGVIGAEGQLTGDGRLIEYGALTWAAFPLPLRWAPVDYGGHDGAVLVGLINAVRREDDGRIRARGVLDLGSEVGREATRLIRGRFLSGISFDLDSTTHAPADVEGVATSVYSGGRVRAATLVAIPAFDEARIGLLEDDCGCDDFVAEGTATLAPQHLLTYRTRH